LDFSSRAPTGRTAGSAPSARCMAPPMCMTCRRGTHGSWSVGSAAR